MKRRPFGTITQRPPRPGFYVLFTWDGRRYKRHAGPTKEAARKKLAAAHAMLSSGLALPTVLSQVFGDLDGSRMTFREAAPHYLAFAVTRKKPSTLAGDVRRLRLLCAASWAGELLSQVRPDALLRWIAERQASESVERRRPRRADETIPQYRNAKDRMEMVKLPGASGATVNRDLALGSALYRWAIRAGHAESNPFRSVERFSEKGRARETYLTGEEARGLVEGASPVLRPLLVTALATGRRRGALLALRWMDVDLDRREVVFRPEADKTGRGGVVKMGSALFETMATLKANRIRPTIDGSDAVFTLADGFPLDAWQLRKLFEPTVARCQAIPLSKRPSVTFHTLRHTAASLMAQSGVSLPEVANVLGHSTLAVTRKYAHFAPDSGQAAIDRLDTALGLTSRATKTVAR